MLNKIENLIQTQIGLNNVNLCGSGTIGFMEILKDINFQRNDELLVPDFICEIIAIPLLKLKIKFRIVDVCKGGILPDLACYQKEFNSHTRVILLAYLWGYVHNDLAQIVEWAKSKNLIIIEDIASAYALKFKGKNLGTFGDYCFGSFGKGKIIDIGCYGFYTRKNKSRNNIPFFSKEVINYTTIIKKIRIIQNRHIRKSYFICLSYLSPFYLGYQFETQKILKLINQLLNLDVVLLERQENTKLIYDSLKNSANVKIYPVNNDLKICTRVCCFYKHPKLYKELCYHNCWIGNDFNFPISMLLNRTPLKNTRSIVGKIFNILTNYENSTLKKTFSIINNEWNLK